MLAQIWPERPKVYGYTAQLDAWAAWLASKHTVGGHGRFHAFELTQQERDHYLQRECEDQEAFPGFVLHGPVSSRWY